MENCSNYIPLEKGISLIIDYRGKTPAKLGADWTEKGIMVVSAKNVHDGTLDNVDSIRYVSIETYKKWMKIEIQRNDIFIASEGASIGESLLWNSDEKIVLGQRLFAIRCNTDILNPFYLAMYMRTPEYRKEYFNYATGTSVLGISQPSLLKTKIKYIPISQQNFIGQLYYNICSKIENNNKINAKLEEMAQALFKSWFIDFEPFKVGSDGSRPAFGSGKFVESELGMIPEGWKVGKLCDLLSLAKHSIKKGTHKDLPYMPIDVIPMNSLAIVDVKPNEEAESSLQIFHENSIVIGAMRVYFHRVILAPFEGITRNTCFVLENNQNNCIAYSVILCNQNSTIDFAQSTSKGSTMPYAVWDGGLAEMKIIIPPNDILVKFNNLVMPILDIIKKSYFENRNLRSTRDTLLPKLMSGEIEL